MGSGSSWTSSCDPTGRAGCTQRLDRHAVDVSRGRRVRRAGLWCARVPPARSLRGGDRRCGTCRFPGDDRPVRVRKVEDRTSSSLRPSTTRRCESSGHKVRLWVVPTWGSERTSAICAPRVARARASRRQGTESRSWPSRPSGRRSRSGTSTNRRFSTAPLRSRRRWSRRSSCGRSSPSSRSSAGRVRSAVWATNRRSRPAADGRCRTRPARGLTIPHPRLHERAFALAPLGRARYRSSSSPGTAPCTRCSRRSSDDARQPDALD